ncbi:hypothetical protein [Psychrobacillus vulpis]|uniref:Uncharacterized protein n=1 Tax=Psychrobacillus vulpis TaxID=2325572 RepID=A0A544TNZ4_9BACI|nr:hypothetical protein [Psychrobacillus vulpis]TQR19170.1 hypothetical protein FG384_14285 [Psychrobacillus vulpis]
MIKNNLLKKESPTSTVSLIIIFIFALTVVLFDYFPGAYLFEENSSNELTVIKNGILKKVLFSVDVTSENELKVALLKNSIIELKGLWFANWILLPSIYLMVINLREKSKNFLIFMVIFGIIAIPLSIYSYITHINFIEHLIQGLIAR